MNSNGLNPRNLCVLAYASGFTSWVYCLYSPIIDAFSPGYFDDAIGIVGDGDTVIIRAHDKTGMFRLCINGKSASLSEIVTTIPK